MTGFPFDEVRTTPLKGTDWYFRLDDATRYTAIVKDVCRDLNVMILDYFQSFSGRDLSQFYASDGLHFNEKGHAQLFTELKDFIERNFIREK